MSTSLHQLKLCPQEFCVLTIIIIIIVIIIINSSSSGMVARACSPTVKGKERCHHNRGGGRAKPANLCKIKAATKVKRALAVATVARFSIQRSSCDRLLHLGEPSLQSKVLGAAPLFQQSARHCRTCRLFRCRTCRLFPLILRDRTAYIRILILILIAVEAREERREWD